jgi:hypothetical protein
MNKLLLLLPLGLLHAQTPALNALQQRDPLARPSGRIAGAVTAVSATQVSVLPRILAGSSWNTTVMLLNSGSAPATFQQNFFAAGGRPAAYTVHSESLSADITTTALQGTLAPGATVAFALSDPSGANPQGWSLLTCDAGQAAVRAYAVIRRKGLGSGVAFETVEPASSLQDYSVRVPFDNTLGFESQLTLVNPAGNLPAQVRLTYLDSHANTLLIDAITVQPGQLQTLSLPNTYPDLANKTGSVQVQADISLFCVTAVRYNPAYGVVSALPVFGQSSSQQ